MGNNLKVLQKSSVEDDEKIMANIQYKATTQNSNSSSSSSSSSSYASNSNVRSNTPIDMTLQKVHSTSNDNRKTKHMRKNSSVIIQKMSELITPSAVQINKEISDKLMMEQLQEKYTLNVLLLGSADSGKSLIFKQMERVFHGKINETDMRFTLRYIQENIINDIINLCKLNKTLNDEQKNNGQRFKVQNAEIKELCLRMASTNANSLRLSRELATEIYVLWNDEAIQNTYFEAKALNMVDDNTQYFMDKILNIVDPDYITTFDDYIRIPDQSNMRGVVTKQFLIETKYGKYKFNVANIGPQKSSKQRKWIRYLDNINVVIYVVNVSRYDEFYDDDQDRNCLVETLKTFSKISNNSVFDGTDFVIFFNKISEFNSKMLTIPFTVCKPEFDPEYAQNKEYVQKYIIQQFKHRFLINQQRALKRGNIYFHEVDDSDSEQIGILLQKVQTDVITTSMKKMGYVF